VSSPVYALSREVSRARIEGRKSQHDSDRLNADIVAKRLVRYLDKAGYVVMKKPPLGGHDQVARGFGQR
jgi:hypothetical protein